MSRKRKQTFDKRPPPFRLQLEPIPVSIYIISGSTPYAGIYIGFGWEAIQSKCQHLHGVSSKRFYSGTEAICYIVEHSNPSDPLVSFPEPTDMRFWCSLSAKAVGWETWWPENLCSALVQAGRPPPFTFRRYRD